jgi:hypothetical protein
MLGGLVGFWLLRPYLDTQVWTFFMIMVLFWSSKVATLLILPARERRALPWGRLVAYLFFPGMRPRLFLPDRVPADTDVVPTPRGFALNLLTGVFFFWVLPLLLPAETPYWLRVVLGVVGSAFVFLFALMDAAALLYRRLGVAVEKLWVCPIASRSLNEFWGTRWNRIFSGMLRETLFLPLARRVGVYAALFAVFLYSGLVHENNSVASESYYGQPTLYFLIQFAGVCAESTRPVRTLLRRYPVAGWLWTCVVVVAPVRLLFHDGIIERVIVVWFGFLGVPGFPVAG